MGKPVVAVFTFFSRTTCGHCKHFKGETTDAKGRSQIDPNSGWEVLTADRELQDIGVEFQLYQFGPEKDPETGVVKNYALDEEYVARVKGIPRLEMSVPDDPHNFIEFNDPELRGWNADQSVHVIKRWIIKHLSQEPFKSWRPKAKVARPPEVIMPAHRQAPTIVQQPQVSPSTASTASVAQVQRQVYQANPRQQALINRGAKQPVARPQYGQPTAAVQASPVNRSIQKGPIVQQKIVVQPKVVEEKTEADEVDSLQEEEPQSDEENSGDEQGSQEEQEKSSEVSDEDKQEEVVKQQPIAVQSRRPEMPPPQRRPVQRQPIVKNSRPAPVVQAARATPSARPMATQPVQTASPRLVVQAAAPPKPVVQAAPAPVVIEQAKPRFLPSNWDN